MSDNGATEEKNGDPPKLDASTDIAMDGQEPFSFEFKTSWEADSNYEDDCGPHIDVVHIAALCAPDKMLSMGTLGLGQLPMDRREFVCRLPMGLLLNGDAKTSLTMRSASMSLLLSLKRIREQCTTVGRRGIIFVAYDFGAILLKNAMALASKEGGKYDDIFYDTAATVFCGCPQRSPRDLEAFQVDLLQFLLSKKTEEWGSFVTLSAVTHLARAIDASTSAFINSRLSIRSRVITLYAKRKEPEAIDAIWDGYTGTLGLLSEFVIEEKNEARFPYLETYLTSEPNTWVAHSSWLPWEQFLLSITAAPRPSTHMPSQLESLKLLLENPVYTAWVEGSGPRILYIHGTAPHASHEMADKLLWQWRMEKSSVFDNDCRAVSFTFDCMDPLRDSMADFIVFALSQLKLSRVTGVQEDTCQLLRDQFAFRGGWTEKALLSAFEFLRCNQEQTVFLFHDFDQCDEESRSLFHQYLQTISEGTEEHLRIVVTSQKPHGLLTELSHWPQINTDQLISDLPHLAADASVGIATLTGDSFIPGPLTIFQSPRSLIVERLKTIDGLQQDSIFRLIQDHTGWPHLHPEWSVGDVLWLLDGITAKDGLAQVLHKIFIRYSRRDEFDWMMSWLVTTARPLTETEFASFLYVSEAQDSLSQADYDILALEAMQVQLRAWLRGLTVANEERVILRREYRDIIMSEAAGQKEFHWHWVREQSHQMIAEFCLRKFQDPAVCSRLHTLFEEYQGKHDANRHDTQIVAPLTSDGVDIVFYLIQYFPYHLAHCAPAYAGPLSKLDLVDPNSWPEGLAIWARVYWAMTNPFLRPPGILEATSAWPTFIGLELLPLQEDFEDINMNNLALLVAAYGNRGKRVSELLRCKSFSHEALTDALVGAVSAGDEVTAIELAEYVLKSHLPSETDPIFPSSLTWAIAWLDMASVTRILLQSGSSTEPPRPSTDPGSSPPSPLYVATILKHPSTVKILLDHGAKVDVLRREKFTPLNLLVLHPQLWSEYGGSDRSCLQVEVPLGLFYGGPAWGSWWSIPRLLEQEPNVDLSASMNHSIFGSDMTPLVSACTSGYPKTVKALLEAGADPDHPGPWHPLWLATVWCPNVEILQHLLHHKVDLNNETLGYPLLYDLMTSEVSDNQIRVLGNILLDNDAPVDINARTSTGQTALMGASGRGRPALVTWLLSRNADPSILDNDDESALHFAVREKNLPIVQELLSKQPDLATNERAVQPLLILARHSPEMVRLLLDFKANPERINENNQTVMNLAVVDELVNVAEILVEHGVNIHQRDTWGATPICDVVDFKKDVRLLRLLIENGANLEDTVEESGNGLLHLAVNGSPENLRILLEYTKFLDLNRRNKAGRTPLLAASSLADTECLKLLVNAGADINFVDERMETSLHNSIHWQLPELRDLLMSQREVRVDISSPYTGTPLHLACKRGQLDTIMMLLDKGADVNQLNVLTMYCSPLVAALLQERPDQEDDDASQQGQIVRKLINHGANVRQSIRGLFYCPLAAACFGASVATINLLLDEGAPSEEPDPISGRMPLYFAALSGIENFQLILHVTRSDPNVTDRYGKSALHCAAQYGHVRTVEHILSLLSSPRQRTQALEEADCDGWTALCWAARPVSGDTVCNTTQCETRNYPDTIRLLLQHGSDRGVQARWGSETLTPLEIAQRCDADPETIDLLQPTVAANEISSRPSPVLLQKFTTHTDVCDICLGVIYGLVYRCSACPDYYLCTKCYPICTDFHPLTFPDDNQDHIIALDQNIKEFQDTDDAPAPPLDVDLTSKVDAVVTEAPVNEDTANAIEGEDDELQEMTINSDGSF